MRDVLGGMPSWGLRPRCFTELWLCGWACRFSIELERLRAEAAAPPPDAGDLFFQAPPEEDLVPGALPCCSCHHS